MSGQTFRWRRVTPDEWIGADGPNWYRVFVRTDAYEIESNGQRSDFEALFRLDWDGRLVESELIGAGPELAGLVEQVRGLRVMRMASASEVVASFLCAANNHIPRITSMVEKLAAFGEPFEDEARLFRFPNWEAIASVPETRLRELGFGYRSPFIVAAAKELAKRGGEGYLQGLKSHSVAEARAELTGLKGIGRKSADCILLFGLDFTEVVPIDTHIGAAMTRLYFPDLAGKALTDGRYELFSDFFQKKFGKLAGWAQQALFLEAISNRRRA